MHHYTSCSQLSLGIDVKLSLTKHIQATAGRVLSNVPNLHALHRAADYTINILFWVNSFYGSNCWSLIININIFLNKQ